MDTSLYRCRIQFDRPEDEVEVGDKVVDVISTNGDTHLGGDDVDQRVQGQGPMPEAMVWGIIRQAAAGLAVLNGSYSNSSSCRNCCV